MSSSILSPQSPPFLSTAPHFPPKTLSLKPPSLALARRLRCRRRRVPSLHVFSDGDLLGALTASSPDPSRGGSGSSDQLPAVRSYEVDLACLTLVGSVGLEQAVTAAAADGGEAAEEHLANGMETMVVETFTPGGRDQHSTVSTRLFLPAKMVKEKARKLRSTLTADILSSNGNFSGNIFAMTFRQVVLHTMGSYKLSIFFPGSERDMEHLTKPREVLSNFALSSSDTVFLSNLAEVVCSCALEFTKMAYVQNEDSLPLIGLSSWFQKPKRISLIDSSICLSALSEGEIAKIARNQVERFKLEKGKLVRRQNLKQGLWELPKSLQLDKIGGPGFSEWVNEFIPAYRLQVDMNMFKDVKLHGWQESSNNRWEVLLTHFQTVELVNVLDMYSEDQYTLPDKELSCGLTLLSPNIPRKKNSLCQLLILSIVGGCVLVCVSVFAQLSFPNLLNAGKRSSQNKVSTSTEAYCSHLKSLEAAEVEALCKSIIQKIKDELAWSGDIVFDRSIGAWIGILPSYLREENTSPNYFPEGKSTTDCSGIDSQDHVELKNGATDTAPSREDEMAILTTAQNIASYQVVMSGDGNIVGFQPTSRVAVNNWASNPLAKLLYGGQSLSPGFLEPRLTIPCPSEVVLIELLMSVDPESRFALARLMQ